MDLLFTVSLSLYGLSHFSASVCGCVTAQLSLVVLCFWSFPHITQTFPSARKRNLSILRICLLFWIFYFYFQACCLLINVSHVIVILILKLVISKLVTFSYFILRFDIVVLNVQLCIYHQIQLIY